VLKFFDPKEEVVLSVDASKNTVGAVRLQNGRPIGYSSKAITSSQENYCQIEKEMLAVVHGCEKFRDYIYGRKIVLVETDHRPLEALFTKPIHKIPMRLQKMRLKLQTFDLMLKYKAGRYMYIADVLSRCNPCEKLSDDEDVMYI